MNQTDIINRIGRQIGEALDIPDAFRVEHDALHIRFDCLDAAAKKLGKVKLRQIISAADYDVTDKGLIWEV